VRVKERRIMPYDEPVSLAVCPSCSTPVYRVKVGGIEYTANLAALDAQQAVAEVIAGRRLYRLTFVGGSPVSLRPADNRVLAALNREPDERPTVVSQHPCTAVSRPLTPGTTSGSTSGPKARQAGVQSPAGRTTPSSAPSTERSGVPAADRRPSDVPQGGPSGSADVRCSECGQPCEDGTYASIGLGELTLWAAHFDTCPVKGPEGA
jgi:hypothetical protein